MTSPDYDTDFYAWTQAQAAAIRAGTWDAVDRAHLAEEVEDVGKSERRALVSHLRVLLTHQGRLVTRGRLLRAVWGEAYQGEDHYVHVYVSQLRRKLSAADPDGSLRDLIVTEPGVGYRVRSP